MENLQQETWTDYSTAMNEALPSAAEVELAENETEDNALANALAIIFQETFADPLGKY